MRKYLLKQQQEDPSISEHLPEILNLLEEGWNENSRIAITALLKEKLGKNHTLNNPTLNIIQPLMHAFSWALSRSPRSSGPLEVYIQMHELGNKVAGISYPGIMQIKAVEAVHEALQRIAASQEITPTAWKTFITANSHLMYAIDRVRPLEEVVATYIALTMMASEVKRTIESTIKQELEKQRLLSLYNTFADVYSSVCESEPTYKLINPISMRFVAGLTPLLMFASTALFYDTTLDPEQSILLTKEAIESVTFDIQAPSFRLRQEATLCSMLKQYFKQEDIVDLTGTIAKNRRTTWFAFKKVFLIGDELNRTVNVSIHNEDNIIPTTDIEEKVFLESMRQQLHRLFLPMPIKKPCSLLCPFQSSKQTPCCGRRQKLWNIYNHLPTKERTHLTPPTYEP